MICWTSFLNKITAMLLGLLLLSGCAGRGGGGSTPLRVDIAAITQEGRQVVGQGTLRVRATTEGATGPLRYILLSQKGGMTMLEASGDKPTWQWRPKMPGAYRLQVVAMDEEGRRAASAWSARYHFAPALDDRTLVALLPPDNISGAAAPLADIHAALRRHLTAAGLQLLEAERLSAFMKKHRMRHTGGLDRDLARALRQETGAEAVFISALESWQERGEPRVAMLTRLVLTTDPPEIVWMDSVGLAGNERPGLLGLDRITSPTELLNKALTRLIDSLDRYMAGQHRSYRGPRQIAGRDYQAVEPPRQEPGADLLGAGRRAVHAPRSSHRLSGFAPDRPYSVAVVPFLNIEARPNAGQVMALHFVKELHRYENIQVIEPGVVRHTLLKYRMIMEAGPSLAVSDVLANNTILGADLILSGKVFDYQGETTTSKVDFSVQIFDGPQRRVVWNSRSYADGDERVYFFDMGRIASAHGLASRMAGRACEMFLQD